MAVSLTLALLLAPAATASTNADQTCAVWARETEFAQSLARHDAAAFREHWKSDAVFVGGDGKGIRGRNAIAEAWAELVEGKGLRLYWYPDGVDVTADGRLALSRGPYWMEDPAQPEATRYRVGRFISTWVRDSDGKWRVAFDGGSGARSKPATRAEVEQLKAAQQACPAKSQAP